MSETGAPVFSLSIVSHGQAALIRPLLTDLEQIEQRDFEVIVTLNIQEDESGYGGLNFPLRIIRNAAPKGFGANHNAAFEAAGGAYFCVVNPDIRIPELRLEELRRVFDDPSTGACAPLVFDSQGRPQDSARRFPTVWRLARRVLLRERGPDYDWQSTPVSVDWVAGMFVMVRREAFLDIGGFDDQRFFMYYEDVDFCERLQRKGWAVRVQPSTRVTHDAQRASHRNLQHLRWHITSAVRYLTGL